MSIFDVNKVHERKALAVAVRADFRKILEDHLSNEHYYATTWTRGVVISHGDAPRIVSVVSQIMDEFIDEYLEVNDAACNAGSTQRKKDFYLGPLLDPKDLDDGEP